MKKAKLFIIYFPVILVSCQVIVNLLYFIWFDAYINAAFYLNTFFGTNVLFALFLLAFTYWFRFCAVSRYSAWAEILFALNYMVVQQDNLYNIIFQIIVGITALLLTTRFFIHKFPLCSIALVLRFFESVTKERSCRKGLDMWEKRTYHVIQTKSHAGRA